MPAKENALLGRTATDFSYDGTWSAGVQTNLFTDGKIDLKVESWERRIADGGGFVSYRLSDSPNGTRLRNVRVTTTHKDTGRSEVRIDSLLVKTVGGEDVVCLAQRQHRWAGRKRSSFQQPGDVCARRWGVSRFRRDGHSDRVQHQTAEHLCGDFGDRVVV